MNKIQIALYLPSCLLLASCASNDHLVFFTNTTIGVEIGSEPESGSPARFIVGYKRQEGVIDPLIPSYIFINNESKNGDLNTVLEPENGGTNIILTPHGTAIPHGVSNRAHSVLAKMNFGATGGGSGASAAQFFATGRAADHLAQSDYIAGALSGTPLISNKSKINLDFFAGNDYAYLSYNYGLLNSYINNSGLKKSDALMIKQSVDKLDVGSFKQTFERYSLTATANDYDIKPYSIPANQEFTNVPKYISAMIASHNMAKKMILDPAAKKGGQVLTAKEKQTLIDNIVNYTGKIETAKNLLANNESVIDMVDFVRENILIDITQ